MSAEMSFYPPLDPQRRKVLAPVREVTLQEDRAQVRRVARFLPRKGTDRLMVIPVTPVMQDVSLRAEVISGDARVINVRIKRCLRVRREELPEDLRALEATLEKLSDQIEDTQHECRRALDRYQMIAKILILGAKELPQDAAWGMMNASKWYDNFQALFTRSRSLREKILEDSFREEDLLREFHRLTALRELADNPNQHFIACIELDLEVDEATELEIAIDYVVPNAMWRPSHRARLVNGRLHFITQAALWQNTGEDWEDADLTFSTARSSLGIEPPLLQDDFLSAQRRQEEEKVQIEEREVQVQSTSNVGSSPEATGSLTLPGVDDGGEVRNLRAQGKHTVPSDGRPRFVPLFSFEDTAHTSLVCMPEVAQNIFLKSIQHNTSPHPILAGPVELLRDTGPVGWTQTLFVAPGAQFALSFGPQDSLSVSRESSAGKSKRDPVDKWTRQITRLDLFLSNLSGDAHTVEVTERIPVSEIEHVRLRILDEPKKTTLMPRLDDNGFCHWTISLEPHAQKSWVMRWEKATAPDVVDD